jgi:Concanavalin A-like lectin/glucanases superfamily
MATVNYDLVFDGEDDYIEIPDNADFSVATTGQLSVSAWIRPDVLTFPVSQSTGYVHWMGKGEIGQHEWAFRMYNLDTTDIPPRPNRISFYVFNLDGGQGIGSHFQEPVQAGQWIHVVGIADGEKTSIYKDGEFKDCDRYIGTGAGPCHNYPPDRWITPTRGTAPLRLGTRDRGSYFLGAIREVRIWSRALMTTEVGAVFCGAAPSDGLVAEYLLGGDIALDSSGLHNGLIAGATWVAEMHPDFRGAG